MHSPDTKRPPKPFVLPPQAPADQARRCLSTVVNADGPNRVRNVGHQKVAYVALANYVFGLRSLGAQLQNQQRWQCASVSLRPSCFSPGMLA